MYPQGYRYGDISWTQAVGLLQLPGIAPFKVLWDVIRSPFVKHLKHRSFMRVVQDSFFRYLASMQVPQIQYMLGTTLSIYKSAVKKMNLSPVVEDIQHGGKLLWIGAKRTDRVILYCHGGAFFAPVPEPGLFFWRYIQKKLDKGPNGVAVGIAVLQYTLVPEDTFPIQLKQVTSAVQHLLASGVQPRNIQIVGDSAGSSIITQLLLHNLRPIPGVETLDLPAPLGGAYLLCPWVTLTADTGSHSANAHSDVLQPYRMREWGSYYLSGAPASQHNYIEAGKAPAEWFDGSERIVRRILVTAGSDECLHDDIVVFGEMLKGRHPDVTLFVQQGGVHNDVYQSAAAGRPGEGELAPVILNWLARGFAK